MFKGIFGNSTITNSVIGGSVRITGSQKGEIDAGGSVRVN